MVVVAQPPGAAVATVPTDVPMEAGTGVKRSRSPGRDDEVSMEGAIEEINMVLYSMSTASVDVSELFNAQVFTTRASAFNLTPGTSFDLRDGYDLGDEKVRESVWAHLVE